MIAINIGGLIGDTFRMFLSDGNVMAAIIVSIIVVTLLIIATDLLRGRW